MTASVLNPGNQADAESFRILVEAVQDYAIFLLDLQGRVTSWTQGAKRTHGYEASEIIGRHFSLFYPPEEQHTGKWERELFTASSTGRFEEEGWRVRKDGTRFWANIVVTALRNQKGELIGYGKVTRDLTERRQAEESLRLSEERTRLMLDAVKDYAIFMLDPQGRVATWNPGAERLKGYKASEIIGRHFSAFYLPEDAHRCPGELATALSEGRYEEEGWRIRKDGSRFWASVLITAVHDQHGHLRGFAKVTRDLTAHRRAEEERLRLAKIDEALRLRDEFLSLAAHELRTPLTPLMMHLQSVERQLGRNERIDPATLAKARRQVRRLGRLIDDLLDFSRVQEGRLELERTRSSLIEIITPVVDDFQSANPSHAFVFSRTSADVWVNVDPLRIEQVIVNLLQNAVKYSPSGGTITIDARAEGSEAVISVSDQGIGIPAEDLPRLFERFFRAQNATSRNFAGLGLGLYLSNEIVARHGGRFEVTSEPNRGSTFRFRLPLIGAASGESVAARVLIVDDDPSIVEATEEFLRGEGYEVHTALNGEEALALARQHHYALMMVDLMMPVLDGAGLIEQLRQERIAEATPIMLFSADSAVRSKAARLGVEATLRKPLDLDDLAAAVRQLTSTARPPAQH